MKPTLSIIILTKDKPGLIIPCILSLLRILPRGRIEIIIGDTGSNDEQVLKFFSYLESEFRELITIRRLGSYHFSKNNNLLAAGSKSDFLLFLNNDTLAVDDFISPLMNTLTSERIGIVGSKLLYANKTVQHAGMLIRKDNNGDLIAYHPFQRRSSEMPYICKDRNYPAVTGACLMIRRDVFLAIGGFNETYAEESQDVDLCLKVRARGMDVRYVSKSQLYHFENGSRTRSEHAADRDLFNHSWKGSNVWHNFGIEHESKPKVFIRRGARGDVLACTAILKQYRKTHPDDLIVFATDFPELIERDPAVDIACFPDQLKDFAKNAEIISLEYETGKWLAAPITWIQAMAATAGVRFREKNEARPRVTISNWPPNAMSALANNLKTRKYIVISTAAGSKEREWTREGWSAFTQLSIRSGFEVIRIGGSSDFHPLGAMDMSGCDLSENFLIVKHARLAVLLDSFPLHLAISARKRTVLLTCQTSRYTVNLTSEIVEFRNQEAEITPLPYCSWLGCRHKFGDGQDNPCAKPILSLVSGSAVFAQASALLKEN